MLLLLLLLLTTQRGGADHGGEGGAVVREAVLMEAALRMCGACVHASLTADDCLSEV